MTQHAGRRRSVISVAASAALAVIGAVILVIGQQSTDGPPQPGKDNGQPLPASASASASAIAAPTPAGSPTAGYSTRVPSGGNARSGGADLGPFLTASPPVAVDIPSIGVRARTLVDLGLAANRSLEVPKDFSAVGWYSAGPSPGQLGPAILAGHVDSHNGPAIFYRLGALRSGAQVIVSRKDGSTAKFTVDRIQRFSKDRFPVAQVYGNVHRAELRLITCGGSFDPRSGHYVDNVVAFAHLKV
jgi:hypothetical protein